MTLAVACWMLSVVARTALEQPLRLALAALQLLHLDLIIFDLSYLIFV
jgi:hypothetical protein